MNQPQVVGSLVAVVLLFLGGEVEVRSLDDPACEGWNAGGKWLESCGILLL